MLQIKCDCCNAVHEAAEAASVLECQNCGSQFVAPQLASPEEEDLYGWVCYFRNCGQYDKAQFMSYKLAAANPSDPQARWLAALSKYGVRFDSAGKGQGLKPKVMVGQKEPFDQDPDVLAALELATESQRKVYEDLAQKITEANASSKRVTGAMIAGLLGAVAAVVAAYFIAVGYVIPQAAYNAAQDAYESANYESAVSQFKALGTYKDSRERVRDCQDQIVAEKIQAAYDALDAGDYQAALDYVDWLQYKKGLHHIEGTDELLEQAMYGRAEELFAAEDYKGAINLYKKLPDYKDAPEKLARCRVLEFKTAQPGDVFRFGVAATTDVAKWKVLEREGDLIFVVATEPTTHRPFGPKGGVSQWSKSTLREWLNSEFLEVTFTPEERALIQTVTVVTPDNDEYGTSGGESTQDKVFVLSAQEYQQYFASDEDRAQKIWEWTRSPGMDETCATIIHPDGMLDSGDKVAPGTNNVNAAFAYRPAMWIDTSQIK